MFDIFESSPGQESLLQDQGIALLIKVIKIVIEIVNFIEKHAFQGVRIAILTLKIAVMLNLQE